MRARLLVGLLCLAPVSVSAQAMAAQSGFTPVPCPDQPWVNGDPSFEALPSARAYSGTYDGGLYQIEIPESWNGELVLYAHGAVSNLGPDGSRLRVQVPALRTHWIERGFAWAASSYRCNGNVYGIGLEDTMELPEVFVRVTGARAPSRTYLVGQSLGGRITVLGIREFPQAFDGALAMCPAGEETNDFRAAVAAAAELVTGVKPTAGTLERDLARMTEILGTTSQWTEKGRQLASIQIEISGGARPFAVEGFGARFIANVRDGVVMAPSWIVRASTNRDVDYRIADGLGLTKDEINRRVPRKQPEAGLRERATTPYVEVLPFDGKLEKPLLTIHGTGDMMIPITVQQAFRRSALAAGKEDLLVQRLMRIPGHCQFSLPEQTRAFDDLVSWVQTGVRPDGDDVLGDLTDIGRKFTNPLRPGDPGTGRVAATAPRP